MRSVKLDSDGTLLPVDSSTAVAPSIKRTWFLAMLSQTYDKITYQLYAQGQANTGATDDIDDDDASGTASDAPASGTVTPKENGAGAGAAKGRAATTMAGGRRRKVVRKK